METLDLDKKHIELLQDSLYLKIPDGCVLAIKPLEVSHNGDTVVLSLTLSCKPLEDAPKNET